MKILFFYILTLLSTTQQPIENGIKTEAKITSIETKTSGRNTYSMAKIDYVTESGKTISSQVQLVGLPFIGSLKDPGDTITVIYQKDNPYAVLSANKGFIQKYTWHIIIGVLLLVIGFRLIKRKKTA
ncbi:hypothetical protein ULMS_16660 [Patiriisocius marinistellae]|uniref:DUF3592 domain-containing protein n=1 Tax=Patiriisocius marinistellae TaxID=2494560 RepID=A0A5J4FXU3_9FLAO|nr:DUF3592 domain-containing protein [Patiriisocius marinistellae]GEQ86158.1 hypothetical protein ULMS_16660 [Patiriisocius marinistellae]